MPPSFEAAARVSSASAAWVAASSRSARNCCSFAICSARTLVLSTLRTSMLSGSSGTYLLTPISGCRPESIRAWVRAAASSMRSFGMPSPMACAMPPASSTSAMCARARFASSLVSHST